MVRNRIKNKLAQPVGSECHHKNTQILCVRRLKAGNNIKISAAHNLRELNGGRGGYNGIDSQRLKYNYILQGPKTSTEVAKNAVSLMEESGINFKSLRHDIIYGVEVVTSLPKALLIDTNSFFRDSLKWVSKYFPAPVVSAVVHDDQGYIHCHIIFVPIVNGRMQGSRLIGYKAKLHAMHVDFFQTVGEKYGLTYKAIAKKKATTMSELVPQKILFTNNSEELIMALGINPIDFDGTQHISNESIPIDFDSKQQLPDRKTPTDIIAQACDEDTQSLSCVGLPLPRNKLNEEAQKRLLQNSSSKSVKGKLCKRPLT